MSPEMIAIIAMGIAIIGVQMTTFLYTLRRMDAMQREISESRQEFLREIGEARQEFVREIGEVKERVARLEGILIGQQEVSNGTFTQTGDD